MDVNPRRDRAGGIPTLSFIRSRLRAENYDATDHVWDRLDEKAISIDDLDGILDHAEIIEKNPEARPYPSCLVLCHTPQGDPLHWVFSREPADWDASGKSDILRIVTVYEPGDDLWERDYKTRRIPSR